MAMSTKHYPTRLIEGHAQDGPVGASDWHDDWDCLNDLIDAELVEKVDQRWRDGREEQQFACVDLCVRLTDQGLAVTADLRKNKAKGGSWSQFRMAP